MASFVHEERKVLGVVVVVARDDIEHHSAIQLLEVLIVQFHSAQNAKKFFVRMALVSVQMGNAGCRLRMNFISRRRPVKTTGHEVVAVTFRQQTTLRHGDAAGSSHLVVGIFYVSDALRIISYLIMLAIGAPVEFQQPI